MTTHAWMTTLSWLMGGLGYLAIVPAMMSPMIFATEQAAKQFSTLIFFASVVSLPVVCWLAVKFSWVVYGHDQRWGLALACAPLLNVAVGAAALTWISLVHDGSFGGP